MDKPSDGVRLNAFNFGNVLFMFPFMMVSRLKISKGLDSPLEHKRRVLKSCGRGERCYLFWVIPPVNHPTRLRSVNRISFFWRARCEFLETRIAPKRIERWIKLD